MSAGKALAVAGLAAGAVWLVMEQQKQQAAPQVVYLPPEPAPASNKMDKFAQIAPFLDMGIDLLNRNKSTGTANSGGLGGFLGGLFGGQGGDTSQITLPPVISTVLPGLGGSGGNKPILDLIGRAEAPQGYNQVYYGTRLQPPRPITTMTIGEVLDWQRSSVSAGSKSSAAGRYQFIRKTLSDTYSRAGLSSDSLFNATNQDKLATVLLRLQGLARFKAGSMTAEQFGDKLARRWAGLPVHSRQQGRHRMVNRGQSYYAGDGLNKATISPESVISALRVI